MFFSVQAQKDSLLMQIEKSDSITHKIAFWIKISVLHADALESDSSLHYAQIALSNANKLGLLVEQGDSYYAMGYANDMIGRLDQALIRYEDSRAHFEKAGVPIDVAKAMNAKGVAAYWQGDFETALKNFLITLEYDERHGLIEEKGDVLQNIAHVYMKSEKYEQALQISKEVLQINKSINDLPGVATAYNVIGDCYSNLLDLSSSIMYYDSAIIQNLILGDTLAVGMLYNSMGFTYFDLEKDIVKAKDNLEKARMIFSRFRDQVFEYNNLLKLGQIESYDKDHKQALTYFLQAEELIGKTDRKELLFNLYENIQDSYRNMGQFDKAYEFLNKYISLNKEINAAAQNKYIEEMQTKYDTEKKEKQIEIQQLEIIKSKQEKNLFRLLLVIIAGGLLFSIIFIWHKIKTNRILSDQKNTIEESLQEKEILLKEIHHRVKNNLQIISSLLSLQGKFSQDPSVESAIREGKNRVKSMSLIHQNLYQKNNLSSVSIKEYLVKLFESLFSSYNIHPDRIKLELDIEDLNLDVDTIIPIGLMVNELVSNSLKYAFPEQRHGIIKVLIKEEPGSLLITVKDNGIGIENPDELGKGDSFGFTLIESFQKKLGADLIIKTENGTCIDIRINNYKKVA